MNDNSLDFLVNETFRMNQEPQQAEIFEDALSFKAPNAPGVIYLIEKVKFVTQLKLSESPDLQKDFDELKELNHSTEGLNFFEVGTYFDAQFLSKSFDKFKVMERSVGLDTQDYNQTWWGGTLKSGEFVIAFGRKPFRDVVEKFELGPLGDSALAKSYFKLLSEKFEDQISYSDKGSSIVLKIEDSNAASSFKSFLLGSTNKISISFDDKELSGLEMLEVLSLKRYFSELSLMRDFWAVVSKQLNEEMPTLH